MRCRIIVCILTGLLVAGCFSSGFCDEMSRPKIGLALSGGGAMGLSHLGVIEFLEEMGLEIDYISGTSMGSIIGGLYASGLSVEEIKKIIKSIDWDNVFKDKPNRKYLSFNRKEDSQRYLFDMELGIKNKKIILPAGMSSGQKLSYILQSVTMHTRKYNSFDEFPVKFRAVATDIETGEKVVLKDGSLAQAMRASMAVPMVFTPVELNNRLLVDGGLVENLPVKTLKDIGVDIIIAVNVSAPLLPRKDLKDMFDIADQTFKIFGLQSARENEKLADVVIRPDFAGLDAVDFDRVDEFSKRGYARAKQNRDEILKICGRDLSREKTAGKQTVSEKFKPEFIDIKGCERVSEKVLLAQFDTKMGEYFDSKEFHEDISRIYGMGYFESITFEPVEKNGVEGIRLNVKEKPWGPNFLRFGVFFQSDFASSTYFDFLTNITFSNLNRLGGEIRNDIIIGSQYRVSSEFFQPITYSQNFFIAPGFIYQKEYHNVYADGRRFAEIEAEIVGGKFDVGYQYKNIFALRQGIQGGWGRIKVSTGPEIFKPYKGKLSWFSSSATFDTLNSGTFPTKGSFANVSMDVYWKSLGSNRDYFSLNAGTKNYVTFKKRHTFFVETKAAMISYEADYFNLFFVGGLTQFPGFRRDELVGQYVGIGQLGYAYRLFDLPRFLGEAAYCITMANVGNVWENRGDLEDFGLRYSGAGGVAFDTKAGPLYLIIAKAKKRDAIVYIGLGNEF